MRTHAHTRIHTRARTHASRRCRKSWRSHGECSGRRGGEREKVACIRGPRASKASRAPRAPAAASSGRALGGVPRERVRLLQRGARASRVLPRLASGLCPVGCSLTHARRSHRWRFHKTPGLVTVQTGPLGPRRVVKGGVTRRGTDAGQGEGGATRRSPAGGLLAGPRAGESFRRVFAGGLRPQMRRAVRGARQAWACGRRDAQAEAEPAASPRSTSGRL